MVWCRPSTQPSCPTPAQGCPAAAAQGCPPAAAAQVCPPEPPEPAETLAYPLAGFDDESCGEAWYAEHQREEHGRQKW